MWTPRYLYRLLVAFIARFKAIIFIAIFLGIACFFLLRSIIAANLNRTETIGLSGKYTVNLPPVIIQNMVTNGLTKVNPDGSVSPDLAASWETPDKGKTWIFKLRSDVKWHDGKSVKASDFKYSFSDVTVSYIDDFTIEFKLQTNYSAFPFVVAKPMFKNGLVGTNDWKVKKLTLSGNYIERMTLINDNDEKSVTYRFFPTEERLKLAFKLGQVSKIADLNDTNTFLGWNKIKVDEQIETGEYVAVFFNTQDKILAEKNMRQALSYAIDKSEYDNAGNRAISPISVNSWAYNSQVKTYKYDPEKAKSIISQFKKDSNSENVEITLHTYPILLSTAEKIAANWRESGLIVKIESVASEPTEFQALLAVFDTPDDPDQYSIWHSTQQETNITHYQNSRIDKLLEDGRGEIDTNSRLKIYLDFQRFLVEDAPATFLYYPKRYTISK